MKVVCCISFGGEEANRHLNCSQETRLEWKGSVVIVPECSVYINCQVPIGLKQGDILYFEGFLFSHFHPIVFFSLIGFSQEA